MNVRSLLASGLTIALLGAVAACSSGDDGDPDPASGDAGTPQKGGVIKVVDGDDVDFLDTATGYSPVSWALQRLYSRTLYAYQSSDDPDEAATPQPDLAAEPPTVSEDGLTYTFTLRDDVKWAPPVDRVVTAQDFVYGISRMYDKKNPSSGQPYGNLIKGAKEFGEGSADSISGLTAVDDHTLAIELAAPAGDILSILSLGFFAPQPEELASKYEVGSDYSEHVAAIGPYMLESYEPGTSMTFVRNPNWDPGTDPLRKAYVDSVEVTMGASADAATLAIQSGDADLSLNLDPPVANLGTLSTDPEMKSRFTTKTTGCVEYMPLNTNPDAGPISDVRVRQAINYALDKDSLRRTRGGTLAGEIASSILPPTQFGYTDYDLYPSTDDKGDVEKAKELLAEAGFPDGLTLNYVGSSTGYGPAFTTAVQASLERVGIKLNIKTYQGFSVYYDSLLFPAKRMEHQIADAEWCPDFPGDGARSFFVPLFDSRSIMESANNNMAEYAVPEVDAAIDDALATSDSAERAAKWAALDQRIMQDAPWAPWLYASEPFVWSERLQNWTYSPWHHNADLTNVWLNQ